MNSPCQDFFTDMAPIRLTESRSALNESNEAIFRSAPMTLVQFYVTIELAREMVGMLGDLGAVQFRDLNSKLTPFQRTFINELKSIDTMFTQLASLRSIMDKLGTISGDLHVNLRADMRPMSSTSEMDQFKAKLSDYHERIKHLNHSYGNLDSQN